jgi:hypothetical protein
MCSFEGSVVSRDVWLSGGSHTLVDDEHKGWPRPRWTGRVLGPKTVVNKQLLTPDSVLEQRALHTPLVTSRLMKSNQLPLVGRHKTPLVPLRIMKVTTMAFYFHILCHKQTASLSCPSSLQQGPASALCRKQMRPDSCYSQKLGVFLSHTR